MHTTRQKAQNDGCLWFAKPPVLSLPVICWVQLKEKHLCVRAVSILAVLVALLPTKIP